MGSPLNRLLEHKGLSLFEQSFVATLVFLFFLVGYLWSGSGHTLEATWDARTWLDDRIPLVPAFILFYMLGYVFVLVPAFLLRSRQDFDAGIAVFVGMLLLAFLCFQFFPVYMHKLPPLGGDFLSALTRHQQIADVPYNNVPSLHVALNLFAWMLIFFQARRAALWWLPLPVCIVLSTVLVKQHMVIDVLGGIVLAACGFIAWRWLRQHSAARVMYVLTMLLVSVVLLANQRRMGVGMQIISGLLEKIATF